MMTSTNTLHANNGSSSSDHHRSHHPHHPLSSPRSTPPLSTRANSWQASEVGITGGGKSNGERHDDEQTASALLAWDAANQTLLEICQQCQPAVRPLLRRILGELAAPSMQTVIRSTCMGLDVQGVQHMVQQVGAAAAQLQTVLAEASQARKRLLRVRARRGWAALRRAFITKYQWKMKHALMEFEKEEAAIQVAILKLLARRSKLRKRESQEQYQHSAHQDAHSRMSNGMPLPSSPPAAKTPPRSSPRATPPLHISIHINTHIDSDDDDDGDNDDKDGSARTSKSKGTTYRPRRAQSQLPSLPPVTVEDAHELLIQSRLALDAEEVLREKYVHRTVVEEKKAMLEAEEQRARAAQQRAEDMEEEVKQLRLFVETNGSTPVMGPGNAHVSATSEGNPTGHGATRDGSSRRASTTREGSAVPRSGSGRALTKAMEEKASQLLTCISRFEGYLSRDQIADAMLLAATSPDGVLRTQMTWERFLSIKEGKMWDVYARLLLLHQPSEAEVMVCVQEAVARGDLGTISHWKATGLLKRSVPVASFLTDVAMRAAATAAAPTVTEHVTAKPKPREKNPSRPNERRDRSSLPPIAETAVTTTATTHTTSSASTSLKDGNDHQLMLAQKIRSGIANCRRGAASMAHDAAILALSLMASAREDKRFRRRERRANAQAMQEEQMLSHKEEEAEEEEAKADSPRAEARKDEQGKSILGATDIAHTKRGSEGDGDDDDDDGVPVPHHLLSRNKRPETAAAVHPDTTIPEYHSAYPLRVVLLMRNYLVLGRYEQALSLLFAPTTSEEERNALQTIIVSDMQVPEAIRQRAQRSKSADLTEMMSKMTDELNLLGFDLS